MWCSDPTLNLLTAFGYNVIRLPKADVKPLQILTRRGKDLDRLGELTTLLQAGPHVPPPPSAPTFRRRAFPASGLGN
jgi:hypothetical protein